MKLFVLVIMMLAMAVAPTYAYSKGGGKASGGKSYSKSSGKSYSKSSGGFFGKASPKKSSGKSYFAKSK